MKLFKKVMSFALVTIMILSLFSGFSVNAQSQIKLGELTIKSDSNIVTEIAGNVAVKAAISIKNTTDNSYTGSLIIAGYDEKDILKTVQLTPVNANAGTDKEYLSDELTNAGSYAKIRAFFWAENSVSITEELSIRTGTANAIVFSASDYQDWSQNAEGTRKAELKRIVNKVNELSITPTGVIFNGDYSTEEHSDSTTKTVENISELERIFSDAGWNVADNTILIQGNHDYSGSWNSTNCKIVPDGENDTEHYGVFALNWDVYGTQKFNEKVIANLKTYLNKKIKKNYTKPIFIASHAPLHYTQRAAKGSNSLFAEDILKVLNNAADKGLEIIFTYGHDHTKDYDAYLGNNVYLKPGDEIYVAQKGNYTLCVEYKLNFTYLNSGFSGYMINPTGDNTLSGTVFEIYDDRVVVKRISSSGLVNLKYAGYASDAGYIVKLPTSKGNEVYSFTSTGTPEGVFTDRTVYTSPQIITLK